MTKKSTKLTLSKLLPIIVALIACCGTVTAAFIGSDSIKGLLAQFYPQSNNAIITVHVADSSGKPLSGAKSLFFYSAGSLSQYTDTNGISTFFIADKIQGNVRLIIEADGYQIYEKQIIYPIESVVDVRLIEKQGSEENVILRAVSESDGLPISGIDVIVSFSGEITRQTTDSDGFAVFTLPFDSNGKLDVQISVNAQGYGIENQFSTLAPGKLQYILLSPNSLRIEIPSISNSGNNLPVATPSNTVGNIPMLEDLIGTGVDISQQTGASGLKVIMLDPNSQPLKYASAEVYEQIADASGNPSRKDRIGTGYINPQGEIDFDLKAGMYAVCPSENSGYGWTGRDCVYNVQVVDNNLTIVKLVSGQIEFGVVDVDGVPLNNVNVEAYTQKPDINENPVTDERVWYGYLENTGTVNIWLTPGLYSISTDLKGYNWGSLSDKKGEVNFVVRKEEKTSYIIRMGRIVVGVTNPDGSPSTGIYVAIYTQKTDVNGSSVIADTLFSGSTDNGGFVSLDLTQGSYAVKIGDNILYDVPVVWGKTTQTDGKNYQQK